MPKGLAVPPVPFEVGWDVLLLDAVRSFAVEPKASPNGGPPLALALQHRSPATMRSTIALCFLVGERMSLAVLALGGVAHNAVLRGRCLKAKQAKFAHGAAHVLPGGLLLVDSYHVSRLNTNTGRLTEAMFAGVVEDLRRRLGQRPG